MASHGTRGTQSHTVQSHAVQLAQMGDDAIAAFKRDTSSFKRLMGDWRFWADPRQLPPAGDWHSWLMLAGRGFGKTRAGAQWVASLAERRAVKIALVAASIDEARAVLVEGQSGILAVCSAADRPKWEPSRGRLVWRSGAEAFLYSGESPERLRGPEHHYAWCDELAKWAKPQACWDMLQMGLRLGARPRSLITTTPRPLSLLRKLMADPGVKTVRGRMEDNPYLPDAFRRQMREAYGASRMGRQELDGELIDDVDGALWTRDTLEACRVTSAPDLVRVVIGVDPPASATGDACGIIAVGLGKNGKAYVLGDHSVERQSPEGWARAVAVAADIWNADKVVAEANNGGDMVLSVLRAADVNMPVAKVHASRGKAARAEPVSMLYSGGKAFHVGAFPALEDELCGLTSGGGYEGPGKSPDRADACVWAMTELMLGTRGREARVRVV
jgi:phage terminase large subunit-like protein